MTFEAIHIRQSNSAILPGRQNSRAIPSLTLRLQPWLKLIIASICLTQGLRFLSDFDPIGNLMGFGLLVSVPSCCYFGWRDYRALQEARISLKLRWYLKDYVGTVPVEASGD
jgi:hypothetical protein